MVYIYNGINTPFNLKCILIISIYIVFDGFTRMFKLVFVPGSVRSQLAYMQIFKIDGNNNKIIEVMKATILFGHANEAEFVLALCNAVLIKVRLRYLDIILTDKVNIESEFLVTMFLVLHMLCVVYASALKVHCDTILVSSKKRVK